MTDFKEIERLYNRYFKFEEEIKNLIDSEDYEEATARIPHRDNLLKMLSNARKTASGLSQEEVLKIKSYDKLIKEKNDSNLKLLEKYQEEIGAELGKTKKKVKFTTAYSMQTTQKQGVFLDVTE